VITIASATLKAYWKRSDGTIIDDYTTVSWLFSTVSEKRIRQVSAAVSPRKRGQSLTSIEQALSVCAFCARIVRPAIRVHAFDPELPS